MTTPVPVSFGARTTPSVDALSRVVPNRWVPDAAKAGGPFALRPRLPACGHAVWTCCQDSWIVHVGDIDCDLQRKDSSNASSHTDRYLVGLVLLPASARACWHGGHMQIAYLAYSKLTPAAKAAVDRLIMLNPNYPTWVAGASASGTAQIVFVRAAVWADDIKEPGAGYSDDGEVPVRSEAGRNIGYVDKVMHKYWHYMDTGLLHRWHASRTRRSDQRPHSDPALYGRASDVVRCNRRHQVIRSCLAAAPCWRRAPTASCHYTGIAWSSEGGPRRQQCEGEAGKRRRDQSARLLGSHVRRVLDAAWRALGPRSQASASQTFSTRLFP